MTQHTETERKREKFLNFCLENANSATIEAILWFHPKPANIVWSLALWGVCRGNCSGCFLTSLRQVCLQPELLAHTDIRACSSFSTALWRLSWTSYSVHYLGHIKSTHIQHMHTETVSCTHTCKNTQFLAKLNAKLNFFSFFFFLVTVLCVSYLFRTPMMQMKMSGEKENVSVSVCVSICVCPQKRQSYPDRGQYESQDKILYEIHKK